VTRFKPVTNNQSLLSGSSSERNKFSRHTTLQKRGVGVINVYIIREGNSGEINTL
jgi:hypothetical protein